MTIFQIFSVKRTFDKFGFRPNDFFGKMNFRSNGLRLNGDSVESAFGQMALDQTALGQMVFRSNGLSVKFFRWNDFSVKWSRTSHLTEMSFERHFIEGHLTERSLDGITIWPNAVWSKVHFTEKSFARFFFSKWIF
jgi:hypothetical protein